MRRRVAVLAALIAIAASAGPAQAATTNATIQGSAYHPDPINISAGDTVVWKNLDAGTHTVTDRKGSFDSGDIGFNKTYSHTFSSAGTFSYYCTIHGFSGTLKVTGSTTTKPATTTTKAATTTTKAAATTSTKAAATSSTSAKPTTSTSTKPTTVPTVGNATGDTGTSTPTTLASALPKHHDSVVGPLLAAIAVVLAAAAAVGAYLFRRRAGS
jgi:plastocyanin